MYRSLVRNFYSNCSLAVLIYDITSKESFDNIENWLRDLRIGNNSSDLRIFLIGNKIDLENERKISNDEGNIFKERNNLTLFLEASAKTGINIKNIFEQAAEILCKDYMSYKLNN